MPEDPDRLQRPYPIIEERPLPPVRRRILGLRRDLAELPIQESGTRLAFRVNDRYEMLLVHEAIRGNEPTVVQATSVAVVDVGRDRSVPVTIQLPSLSPADAFDVTVTFLCTVEDPARVADQGIRNPSVPLTAYVSRETSMIGHRYPIEQINELRQVVTARITAACQIKPPMLDGISVRLGQVEVQPPPPLVEQETKIRDRTWTDERQWQDKTLAHRHTQWEQAAKDELDRKQREFEHVRAELEQLRTQQFQERAAIFGYQQDGLRHAADQEHERRAAAFRHEQDELEQESTHRLQKAQEEFVLRLTSEIQRVAESGPAAMDAMARALGEIPMRDVADRAIERDQRASETADALEERQWKREQADKDRAEAAKDRDRRLELEQKRLEVAREDRDWQRRQVDKDREAENTRLQGDLIRGFVDRGLLDRAPLDAHPVIAKALDNVFGAGTLGEAPDGKAPPKELSGKEAADEPTDVISTDPPVDEDDL
jgi:hypothetical protein